MHLLFATSIVPDGVQASGYEIANAAIIAALRRAGVRVTVVGFTWPGKEAIDPENTIVLGSLEIRTEKASRRQKLAWLSKALSSGLTFASAKLRVISDQQLRLAIEEAGPVDGYVLNTAQFAGAFEKVFCDKPVLFVAHNVEHRSAQENADASHNLFQRILFRREARLLKQLEERLCRNARFVFTLSEEDRAALDMASNRSAALPLVTRPAAPPKTKRQIECDAALIGTWTWQPNRIGLDWFLNEIVSRLPATFRIRIAGSVPADVKSAHPGLQFVGRVPDAQAFMRGAAVVPLISTAGTGVQLKTIETFELGLPSVATPRSLRGIEHRPANCVVADDPAAFALALEKAVRDRPVDVDGSKFHRDQIKALDAATARGLHSIHPLRQEVPA